MGGKAILGMEVLSEGDVELRPEPCDDLREECPRRLTVRVPCGSGVFQKESIGYEPEELSKVQSLADDEVKV